MVRRLLPLLILTLSLHAQSRYVADAAGAPVKWEGWGPRALERAKKENRPIFLTLGYASSFECFRMQREAFLDGDVAETLNTYYVPVLLDRLEYPEIAEAYEAIARSMGNAQGWPVLLILTPSLEPFAVSGPVAASALSRTLVLGANRWAHERDAAIAEAHQNVLKARAQIRQPPPPEKRPNAIAISLLARTKQTTAAMDQLRKLGGSALHDQLGGGFHRAAHDDGWNQPYFEKMLSDQALLAIAALETWQMTHDPGMEQLARSTLDAALRDLHPPKGAFDASQDAHSLVPAQGPEFWNGAFYVWEKDEVTHLLGREGALKVFRAYGMREGVRNVLAVEDAESLKDPAIAPLLAKMLDVRQKRPQPFRESNTNAALNGLMISALSRAGAVFGDKRYVDAASIAAQVVTKNLWNAQRKTLVHTSGVEATADDYAMLVQGLLDLFEAGYDVKWLELAIAMQQRQDQLFWSETARRYATGTTLPLVLSGLILERDDETPSANSVAAMNLLRLALLTGNEAWGGRPAKIFESFGESAQLPQLAIARAASLGGRKIVAVAGDGRKPTVDMLHAEHEHFEPLRFVLFVPAKGAMRDRIVRDLPFTGAFTADPKTPVLYECSRGECRRR